MNQTQNRVNGAGSVAPLKNVAALMGAVHNLQTRPANTSTGISVMYGPSGYGKTVAANYAQNKASATLIEVRDYWSRKTFCTALSQEIGIPAKGTIADMMDRIIFTFGSDAGGLLIIDEADKLVDKGMIELARDIQEMANVSVILIGEELLPQKLRQHERIHNRVLDWVPAQPCDAEDIAVLAGLFARGLSFNDDLIEQIRIRTGGVTRRVVTTLYHALDFSRTAGTKDLTVENFARSIASGEPPVRHSGRGRQ